MPPVRDIDPTTLALLVGNTDIMAFIRSEIEKIADSNASVLITGPSGSGKDVVAQLIHQRSRRAARPFVALNCAAVAPDLLESEMFGHEAGAFTGAIRARPGRFEAAHGGTLFLDEVGDMATAMQAKLLRVLETRVVERVGGMLPIAVDVRLCAATSVDLFAAIDRGAFRSDLLYRLDVIRIEMPSLADRIDDLAVLIQHFTSRLPRDRGTAPVRFTDAALAMLKQQPWPGNVRELKNFVERAQAHFPGALIGPDDLPKLLRSLPRATAPAGPPPREPTGSLLREPTGSGPREPTGSALPPGEGVVDLKRILADLETAYITEALTATGGAVAATAKRLGLQRTTLIEKMRRLHIHPA